MTAPTHITFAEFIYLLILTTTGVALNGWNAFAIAISSLLPDLDTSASTMGRLLPFVSDRIERRFGHRGLTHSSLFTVLYSLALLPLVSMNADFYICLCVGYFTHPLLDTMTVNGVTLFYPFAKCRCVFPFDVNNPYRYRVQTGSQMDTALALIFAAGCIPAFYVAHQGYERFIRVAQQTIEAAVRDYNEFSRENLVLADIDAYDMLTKKKLKGSFEIVGALNPHTLVFKTPDRRLHTLGKSFQADYVAEAVLCTRGDRARASVRTIQMSNQLLGQLATLIDTSSENYFFGELVTLERLSLPPNTKAFTPISGSGNLLKLNYATLHDIYQLSLDPVYVAKGIVTVRSTDTSSAFLEPAIFDHAAQSSLNVLQLTYIIEPKDSLVIYRQKGDTVAEGGLIATKILPSLVDEQIALNNQKCTTMRDLQAASLADFDQKIAAATALLRSDSAEHQSALDLVKRGFVASASLRRYELKLQKDRRTVNQLKLAREKTRDKTAVQISSLLLSNKQLLAKERALGRQSEIRSPITGVLLEVRRVAHDAKTRLIVIIERIH